METAAEALLNDYEDYKMEFRGFFPELQEYVYGYTSTYAIER
jgi:hypothetical protein